MTEKMLFANLPYKEADMKLGSGLATIGIWLGMAGMFIFASGLGMQIATLVCGSLLTLGVILSDLA